MRFIGLGLVITAVLIAIVVTIYWICTLDMSTRLGDVTLGKALVLAILLGFLRRN